MSGSSVSSGATILSVVGNWSGRLVNPAGFPLLVPPCPGELWTAPGHVQGPANLAPVINTSSSAASSRIAGLALLKLAQDLLERLVLAIERSLDRAQLFEPLVLTRSRAVGGPGVLSLVRGPFPSALALLAAAFLELPPPGLTGSGGFCPLRFAASSKARASSSARSSLGSTSP